MSKLKFVLVILLTSIATGSAVWYLQQARIDDMGRKTSLLQTQIQQLQAKNAQLAESNDTQIVTAAAKSYCAGADKLTSCDPIVKKLFEQHAQVSLNDRDLLISKNTEGAWRVVFAAKGRELCSIGSDAPGLGVVCSNN